MTDKNPFIEFDSAIIDRQLMDSLPVFYRFLRKIPNEAIQASENSNRLSKSAVHKSISYHRITNYKPNSDLIISEVIKFFKQ